MSVRSPRETAIPLSGRRGDSRGSGVLDFEIGVWVVMHRDLKSSRRMRLMFDHLAREIERYIASQ
jgi:hypothetical protein